VVIPVRNGEKDLRASLGSIVAQTLADIEVIVVDDASTDGSRAVIEEFVSADPRFRYEVGPGIGSASAARNVGLDLASGDYLAFLDADDFFAPTMLQELYERAREDDADIVLTKFRTVDRTTRDATPADWALRLQYFPPRTPISPDDLGDHLFFAVNPAAWNKLFRTAFIRQTGLRFQHLRRTNDVYFSYMALALAQRISVVEGYLIDYQVNNSTSLQGSLHESPLEFVQALDRLSGHLEEAGLFPKLERAFVNEAVEICLTNLRKVRSALAFAEVHQALRTEVFGRFGVLNRAPDYFLRDDLASQVRAIMELSTEELLFSRLVRANESTARARAEVREALREMEVRANAARLDAVVRTSPAELLCESSAPEISEPRPEVSVVIPVHNTEAFLAECVHSVLAQTGVSLEVICVDDGSSDASGDVLDQLAKADDRLTVIHQANAGPSVARNRGLEVARGRYLCFVDSDDWWREDALAALVHEADAKQVDLLLFDALPHREAGVPDRMWERFRLYYDRAHYEGVRTGPELLAAMRAVQEYRASPCLYLIRGDYLRGAALRFYPGIVHEDNLFTFELMLGTNRAAHSQTRLYARRVRPGSIMTAGSRLASARGYLITYLEMVRLAGRTSYPEPVATQIGAIIFSAFKQAIDSFVKVNTDVGDRLREVDPNPEAQAAVMLLKRLRYEAQFKRGSMKPAKTAAPAQPRSLPQRALGRLRRAGKVLLGKA
jgi:glycosyltransferase involved in cell wall biosynthesis